ncbi:DEAD/DEAH box helicase [Amnibacterium sp. CER49]|uniref:ATP-dependent DNA helicase n=1 Tax=Amnibacterium sp. CER49 TaxID=3039161 RepID=UPI002446DEFB|nr:DEAD/DEAH box helicase [Amnibacterium sp. CER49]MDH2443664.1 DEAD/DEAH box helicase [Amnibacterium sp. CER49]
MAAVELTAAQQAVVDRIHEGTGGPLLVTGRAGTGKSTLLQHLVAGEKRNVAVCAPTGVAALNVGGQTIHSLFKLPIGLIGPTPLTQDRQLQRLLGAIEVLIVDEVSMVSADLLDAMDRSLRMARNRKEPFGGVPVVLFGDPWQLAPVPGGPEERAFYAQQYRSMWFFDAHVWEETDLEVAQLALIHRQQDDEFRALLTAVRHGHVTADMAARLNRAGARPLPADPPLTLASRNDTVSTINASALAALPGREATSLAEVEGEFTGRSFPADEALRLKEGAHVMMLRNDADGRWVNGSRGVVSRLRPGRLTVEIDGVGHDVEPVTWERHRYTYSPEKNELVREVVAEFRQLPVRLGWAVTIHKAQGSTFDAARIDLGRKAFSPGQTYVALSRLRTIDGLYLTRPLVPGDVFVDPHVERWVAERRAAKAAAGG